MPELEKPGGLSYEFVLEEARTTGRRCETPSMKSPATPTPTAKDIERKLKVILEIRVCPLIWSEYIFSVKFPS